MIGSGRGSAFRWAGIALVIGLVLAGCSIPADQADDSGLNANNSTHTAQANPTGAVSTAEIPQTGEVTPTNLAREESSAETAWLTSMLLNTAVNSSSGEPMARVNGMLIDVGTGQVLYLALTEHTLAGRQILAPWDVFTLVPVENEGANTPDLLVEINVTQSDLAGAPDFSEETIKAVDQSAGNWDADLQAYWAAITVDEKPVETAATASQPFFIKSTGLQSMDDDLHSAGGEQIGEIQDTIISIAGMVQFALVDVVQLSAEDNDSRDLVVVAWRELVWMEEKQAFQFMPSTETLQGAPRITLSNQPDMSLPGWDQAYLSYWMDAAAAEQTTPTAENGRPAAAGLVGDHLLLALPVVTDSGETLGIVEDWLVGAQGQVEYVAITTLAEPGSRTAPPNQDGGGQEYRAREINPGGSWVLLPWNVVQWDIENSVLTFLENPGVFNNAPAFVSGGILDEFGIWMEPVHAYWRDMITLPDQGTPAPKGQNVEVWISYLLDAEISDAQDLLIGAVAGVVMDSDANLRYLLVSDGSHYMPVPWEYFDPHPRENIQSTWLIYTDDPERLEDALSFDSLEAARQMSASQESELRTYWGVK